MRSLDSNYVALLNVSIASVAIFIFKFVQPFFKSFMNNHILKGYSTEE